MDLGQSPRVSSVGAPPMWKLVSPYGRFPKLAWTITLGVGGYLAGGMLLGSMGFDDHDGTVAVTAASVVAVLAAYWGFRIGGWRLRRRVILKSSY